MSSNIRVQRVCEHCGKEFIAATTKTRFCSKKCNSAEYKKQKRLKKIKESNLQTKQHVESKGSNRNTDTGDILSIQETADFLRVSRQTVYNWLKNGTIKGKRMSNRKVLILKKDVLYLLESNEAYENASYSTPPPITEFYTIKEVLEKFEIGQTWLFKIIKEQKIPKSRIGGKTHLSKKHIDNYFKTKRDSTANIKEWYTVQEIQEKFNLTREQVYGRVSENRIPKKKEGKFVKISQQHFDELFIIRR